MVGVAVVGVATVSIAAVGVATLSVAMVSIRHSKYRLADKARGEPCYTMG